MYSRIRTFCRKTFSRSLFQQEGFDIYGLCWLGLRFWNEVNFLRRAKISRRDYLDYLKNEAKSGDIAVLKFIFRNISLGKWKKIGPATGVKYLDGPRQKLIHGRDTELSQYYCNFSEHSSYILILLYLWPSIEACVIEALKTWLVCCSQLAAVVLPTIHPIAAH